MSRYSAEDAQISNMAIFHCIEEWGALALESMASKSEGHVGLFCPSCSSETEHSTLREKESGGGVDLLVRCSECNHVHTVILRPSKLVKIGMTLSDGRSSSFESIESDDDEEIRVGDTFEHDGFEWTITRLEGQDARSMKKMVAGDIRRGWAIRVDRVIIPLTLTDGEVSRSSSMECSLDTIFSCETHIEVEGSTWMIRAIHTGKGRTLRGRRAAADIRRIYLHTE